MGERSSNETNIAGTMYTTSIYIQTSYNYFSMDFKFKTVGAVHYTNYVLIFLTWQLNITILLTRFWLLETNKNNDSFWSYTISEVTSLKLELKLTIKVKLKNHIYWYIVLDVQEQNK